MYQQGREKTADQQPTAVAKDLNRYPQKERAVTRAVWSWAAAAAHSSIGTDREGSYNITQTVWGAS